MKLGQRLRQARKARGFTQRQLAEKVPGASQAAISALEKRDSETTTLLFEFADALAVSPRWLLNGNKPSGLDSTLPESDRLFRRLKSLYGAISPSARDQLVGFANALHTQEERAPSLTGGFGAQQKRRVDDWIKNG